LQKNQWQKNVYLGADVVSIKYNLNNIG